MEHALCVFNKYYRSAQGIQVKERKSEEQGDWTLSSAVWSPSRELEVVEV